jgi:hypothetical protein
MDHHPAEAEAAEVAAAELIAEGAEGAAHEEGRADVDVARIEGETAVELARINAKVEAGWQEARIVELEGQVTGMREIIERLTAPPEPDPGPEPAPAAEVIDEEPPPPGDSPAPPAPAKKSKGGWWG